ncbi:hypothetical protein Tco_0663479 [Tanacetum coccineum]
MKADDQAIQTILMGLPEDIYVAVDSCETAKEIWFTSKDGELIESYYHHFSKLMNDFKRNKHFPEKIACNLKFLNNLQLEWKRHITIVRQTKDLHEVDYTQVYDLLKMNQEEVVQNAVQNLSVQNVGNQNRLIVVSGIANQNANQNGNNNVVAARAEVKPRRKDVAYLQTLLLIAQKEKAGIQLQAKEFDLIFDVRDLDEIKEVNTNCILMANFQQASTSGIQIDKAPIYDSDGSAEAKSREELYFSNTSKMASVSKLVSKSISIPNEEFSDDTSPSVARKFLNEHKSLEYEIECLLRAVFSQDIMLIVQSNSVVDTSNLQTKLDRTKEKLETCIIKKKKEYVVLWNNWYKKCEECKYDKISYDKVYNDLQQKIEQLQAQLGDLKGKSKDTPCVLDTLDLLSSKLDVENVELEF